MIVTRTRGSLAVPSVREFLYYPATKTFSSWSNQVGPSPHNIGTYKYFNGDVRSPWKRGTLKVSPVVIETRHGNCTYGEIWPISDTNCPYKTYNYVTKGYLAAAYFVPATTLPAWWDAMATSVNQRALANINKADVQLGTFAAELGETIQMMRNPLSALRKAAKKARKVINKWQARNSLEGVAGTYLEYIFGWAPTMQDVDKLILHAVKRGRQTIRRLDSSHASYVWNDTYHSKEKRGINQNWWEIRNDTKTYSMHSAQYYQFEQVLNQYTMTSYWGLDDAGFVQAMWAITPYSFVVDWFAGVGDWLRAIMPMANVERRGGSISLKSEFNVHISIVPSYTTCGTSRLPARQEGDSVFTWNRSVLERRAASATVWGSYPAIHPAWLNCYRAAASTALITQQCASLLTPKRRR